MNAKPTYVVLAASGPGWQPHGPAASEHHSLQEAEAAAYELSARYPQRVLGVYELRSVFGTEQRVVKHKVETGFEPASGRRMEGPAEIYEMRAAS